MTPMLFVTIVAVAVAAATSFLAWRVVREERRRSDARVAALAADIHRLNVAPATDLPLRSTPVPPPAPIEVEPAPPRRALATAIGAGALVVAGVAAILVMVTTGAAPVASGGPEASAAARQPAAAVTLDLLALGHEREQDRLTVRGVVRNPGTAVTAGHLTAVVMLFSAEGRFLTSGRADVRASGLPPGAEAPFVVTVPGAGEVGRYRVSFRSDDRVVPHVDRRAQ